jgi:hypothetical protein
VGESLAWYLADAASLLRDNGFQFTSQARLKRWVNLGRQQVAKHSGCLRALVPGQSPFGANANPGSMTPGSLAPGVAPDAGFNAWLNTERYSFAYANPFLQRANSGYRAINDVFNVAVSWSSFRPMMVWMPWDELQAYARAYSTLISSYPMAWSTFGSGTSGQVWLWPPPSQNLEMEWDCTCLPFDLQSNDDYDAIPDSFTSGVKFYAAGMAFLGSFRYGMADNMFKMFLGHCTEDMGAAEGGKVADYYYTSIATT